ncbi:hypothetical protein DTO96_102269 [Ephemeroptericola cinctiostellae]|uniref:26 kDa periplasmic immunogenic protein n=1 Tax=Ephemeroptericola cinctiostellae TaxID=2268024 RepID=A0A345DDS6_9BURK|nr:SIMPL domain-containing protein [Ephemeroptericola cinctiostellae]AXF86514.1 hypothetical protein DTO96_102269 [Ephemeroptericola cinctiostellae]
MHPILKNCLLALPFAGLFVQAGTANAQTLNNINQNGTLVELCASAQQDIMQDSANVNVSYKAENRDKRIAADEVNKKMTEAIRLVKANYPKVDISNQNYNTYQSYTPKGQSKDWTVEQSFLLESKNPSEVPALVSLLQESGVTINGMNTFLSPEAAKAAQQKLYSQAFDDVQMRLRSISEAMGKPNAWQITHIDMTGSRGCGGGGGGMEFMRAKSMLAAAPAAMDVAEPTVEPSKQTIQLSLWIAAKMK